jgi:hypothetical protein
MKKVANFYRSVLKTKTVKNIVHSINMRTGIFFAGLFASVSATAATAPAAALSGTLGYQIYNLVFVNIYGSGGGYAAGVLMLFWAFSRIKADWKEAAYIGIGASGIIALPTIATALGAIVI